MNTDVQAVLAEAYRTEYGRVVATLIRQVGDFELAEDAVQESFVAALKTWSERGIPANPGAWLTTAARRKAIDRIRRSANYARKRQELEYLVSMDRDPEIEYESETIVKDDQLRLIFTCCHPALAFEARVALTLKTLGGLTTKEIARAFLVGEATMAQRIVRAKRKIKAAGIPYKVPAEEEMAERLESVLAVVYLVFNEGYSASAGDSLLRAELCVDAIRLATLIQESLPGEPEVAGLTSLMLFHHARRGSRVSNGELVMLEDQDRSTWDQDLIGKATALLDRAMDIRRPGSYQFQAAIASLHCNSPHPDATDWPQIVLLYDRLYAAQPTPVIGLNRAAAYAMADGPSVGLRMFEDLADQLDDYVHFHSARGELFRRADDPDQARASFHRAIELVENDVQRRHIEQRLHLLG